MSGAGALAMLMSLQHVLPGIDLDPDEHTSN